MPIMDDIQEAIAEGRTIWMLYAKLRAAKRASDRALLLRQAGESADALGNKLRALATHASSGEPDAAVRAALAELGDVMEQVMVQEREYRRATGADPDAAATDPGTPAS